MTVCESCGLPSQSPLCHFCWILAVSRSMRQAGWNVALHANFEAPELASEIEQWLAEQ